MPFPIRTFHLILLAALAGTAGCKKNSGGNNPIKVTGPEPTVFLLNTTHDTLEYWEGSTRTLLPPNPQAIPYVTSMAVANGNVYVSGGNYSGTLSLVGEYWKNGAPTLLPDTAGSTINAVTSAIFVSGNDVYVGGMFNYPPVSTVPWTGPAGDYPLAGYVAAYWKNGAPVRLPGTGSFGGGGGFYNNDYSDYVSGLTVSGNDVYVSGGSHQYQMGNPATYQFARYWKNGVPTLLTGNLLDSSGGAITAYPSATGICVVGNDVYVAGYENSGTASRALYWKNGIPTYLGDNSNPSAANSVFVVGQDVYIAGYLDSAHIARAVYWKNGVPITLSKSPNGSIANALAIFAGEVYAAGADSGLAAWWKNGVITHVGSGGEAYSIAVQ